MEANSTVIALLGVGITLIVCMFSILIAMIVGLKKDYREDMSCVKRELNSKQDKADCIRLMDKGEHRMNKLTEGHA